MEQVRSLAPKGIPIILVGNKVDLIEDRKVTYEEGLKLAESMNISFIEVSALSGEGVHSMFDQMARLLIDQLNVKNQDEGIHLDKNGVAKGKGNKNRCCNSN